MNGLRLADTRPSPDLAVTPVFSTVRLVEIPPPQPIRTTNEAGMLLIMNALVVMGACTIPDSSTAGGLG